MENEHPARDSHQNEEPAESACGGSVIKKCRKGVISGDEILKCAECDQSFHIQCQNITRTRFKKIQELNEDEIADGIEWRCDKCRVIRKEFGKIVKQMDELENRAKDMMERVRIDLTEQMILWKTEILKEMSAERNNMETKLTEEVTKTLEVERKNVEKTLEDRKINQNSKDVEEILNDRLKEEEEKKKRSKNLLIFGVEESAGVASTESNQKDKEAINKIMNLLKINENLTITRLGKKKENSIRPLLVTAKDERTKWHIISKGKMLKESEEYKKVYISPDLTQNERKNEAILKMTLKTRREESAKNDDGRSWTIKKGKVIEKVMPQEE